MTELQILHTRKRWFSKLWTKTKTIKLSLPEKWDELSRSEFIFVSNMRMVKEDAALRISWVIWKLVRIPRRYIEHVPVDDVAELFPLLEWVFEDPVFEKSKVSWIRVGFRKWQGPAKRLSNISIKQFGFVNKLYQDFIKESSDDNLNLFLAALYQPSKFNNDKIEEYAKRFRKVDGRTKTAAFLNYTGLHAHLPERYPRTFSAAAGEGEGEFNVQHVILDHAGDRFGDIDKTAERGIHDIFAYVELQLERDAKNPTT